MKNLGRVGISIATIVVGMSVVSGCGSKDPDPKIELANAQNTQGKMPVGMSAAGGKAGAQTAASQ